MGRRGRQAKERTAEESRCTVITKVTLLLFILAFDIGISAIVDFVDGFGGLYWLPSVFSG